MTTLAILTPLFALYGYGFASSLLHIWQRHQERVAERREGWGGNAPVSYNHNRGSAA